VLLKRDGARECFLSTCTPTRCLMVYAACMMDGFLTKRIVKR